MFTSVMNWIEELPEQCPPKEAFATKDQTIFRLARSRDFDENDFHSQRSLRPNAIFNGVSECIARSLSVFNTAEACYNKLKLPYMRKKFVCVLKINLTEDDGMMVQSGKDINHYSWWRSNRFTLLNAEVHSNE